MRVDPKKGGKQFPKLMQADLEEEAVVLTIAGYEERPMPDGGLVSELTFEETNKPLRLNQTQKKYLIEALGSDDSDDWIGKKVPIEKRSVEGPDGQSHDVVWVSAPDSWAYMFEAAGVKLPAAQRSPARKVVAAASVKEAPSGRRAKKLKGFSPRGKRAKR